MHVQYMFIPTEGSQKSKNMEVDIYKKSHGSHLGAMHFLDITPVLQGLNKQ